METIDAFHRGKFELVQPHLNGHRTGLDAMILGGLVPSDFQGQLVDLGAGVGAAGFSVASRCEGATITLAENSPIMLEFAKKSLDLSKNNHFAQRVKILNADVTLRGKNRQEAGLLSHFYDFALMNPPFNFNHDRKSPDALRQKAHVMTDNMFEDWIRTASAIVKPNGFLGLIARPQSLKEILEALDGRFGAINLIPLQPRQKTPAIRILIHAKKGSKAPLSLLPSLIIHKENSHSFAKHLDAINNGMISFWDNF